MLLSGGLDSATTLACARRDGFDALYCLSFSYGQRHDHELTCAKRLAASFDVHRHIVLPLNLREFGGSALTSDIAVPKHNSITEIATEIPVTYVPARNIVFLSLALALAESVQAFDIYIGVNAVDYSGYPDCRPEFIRAFQAMADVGTKQAVTGSPIAVRTPLIDLSKASIIRLGSELGVDYSMTSSCYDPDAAGRACGHCDSCLIRRQGFVDANIPDPTPYMNG